MAFADQPGDSVLVVPEIVLGRRGDTAWLTTVGAGAIAIAPDLRPTGEPAAAGA